MNKLNAVLAAGALAVSCAAGGVASAVPADPGCHVTVTLATDNGSTYTVKFSKTCGYQVRAKFHENNGVFGTSWFTGNTVSGTNVTSSVAHDAGKGACNYGYEVYSGGVWSFITEDPGGSC